MKTIAQPKKKKLYKRRTNPGGEENDSSVSLTNPGLNPILNDVMQDKTSNHNCCTTGKNNNKQRSIEVEVPKCGPEPWHDNNGIESLSL
jgi:hypothetical protein